MKVDQLTFIIGTNAAGKSNIVDALQFLSRVGSGERLIEICKGIRGGADKIIRKGCAHAGLTVRIKTTPSDLKTERTYDYHIAFSIGDKDAFIVQEKLTQDPDSRPKVLFETEESSSQKLTNQITAKFLKDKPGPRKGVNLRSDVPIICQVQGINVLQSVCCVTREGAHGSSKIVRLTDRPDFTRQIAFHTPGQMMTDKGSVNADHSEHQAS